MIELLKDREQLRRGDILEAAKDKVGGLRLAPDVAVWAAGEGGWMAEGRGYKVAAAVNRAARAPAGRPRPCCASDPVAAQPPQGITVSDSLYSKVVKELCSSRGAIWSLR